MAAKTTKCNYEALNQCVADMGNLMVKLKDAYDKAVNLQTEFADAYEGDARAEIEMFLSSLPVHIYRLYLFYSKMSIFVMMTEQAFMQNDTMMTENMER